MKQPAIRAQLDHGQKNHGNLHNQLLMKLNARDSIDFFELFC